MEPCSMGRNLRQRADPSDALWRRRVSLMGSFDFAPDGASLSSSTFARDGERESNQMTPSGKTPRGIKLFFMRIKNKSGSELGIEIGGFLGHTLVHGAHLLEHFDLGRLQKKNRLRFALLERRYGPVNRVFEF